MKIEKITDNKIRVILSLEDLEKNDLTFEDFASNATEFQTFFVNMLERAEKELGFITKDCKLLIESFSSSEDIFVFTVTKFNRDTYKKDLSHLGKKVTVKKKQITLASSNLIYNFKSFDEFCTFCNLLNSSKIIHSNTKFAKDISLFLYNNKYYLVLTNINKDNPNNKIFYYYLSEFAILVSTSNNFKSKLLEHGKIIMKNNAIKTGIKFFSNN